MLPAADLTEILANLAALKLEPNTVAAVLGAVLAPLLRSSEPVSPPPKRVGRPRGRRAPRRIPAGGSHANQTKPKRRTAAARERARAALQANPDASLNSVAKIAGVSRSTVKAAAAEARKPRREASKPAVPERRQRARRFLEDTLRHGPRGVSEVEDLAARAHVDPGTLERARGDLGVVVSRANAGGVQAVQWALPG